MTYEPGTSDIFTTEDPPFPDLPQIDFTEEQVLANLMRRILNTSNGCALQSNFRGDGVPRSLTLAILPIRLSLWPHEADIVRGAARRDLQFDR